MLFILGHGIVVGNDLFLYDAHANDGHAVTLKDLKARLEDFKSKVGKLELVSFHSCSMSGLEVAYELAGTANYMLASQGPAFVGSWPYKHILVRIFNDVKNYGDKINVDEMIEKIFYYCFYNSYDFQLAGYSFDLCLTDLNRVSNRGENGIKEALEELSDALSKGLPERQDGKDARNAAPDANLVRDMIVLSHWEAQSYFEENFTDLCDFCFCLHRRCEVAEQAFSGKIPPSITRIKDACYKMMLALGWGRPYRTGKAKKTRDAGDTTRTQKSDSDSSPIVLNGFAGPAYQYSNGLAIYFPWSLPEDNEMWATQYQQYELSNDTDNCWGNFLRKYFEVTMRTTQAEEKDMADWPTPQPDPDAELLDEISGLVFNEFGQLDQTLPKDTKVDPTGGDCVCPSIKNYPRRTRKAPASPDLLQKMELFGF